MGAVYGILGDADREELTAIDARLAHRGAAGARWSPAPGVHLGMRGSEAAVQLLDEGVLVFDGAVDNRRQIADRLGRPAASMPAPGEDGLLLLELLHLYGSDGRELIAGQMAVALWHAPRRTLTLGRDRLGYAPRHFTIDGAGR